MQPRTRPIQKFAQTVSQCSTELWIKLSMPDFQPLIGH
ncbi:hypothetical protein OOU_Y34scaffold00765g35 [Pyricularia oryzae Y34]|uniref:Uncharacterized protein n=2 Tax=Pyricularia oryzae TaxID=318829 RepID=A0AA97PH73_PYRO3|nr:hypothetical protein OOU_Y34scaffold00765g35 [Pyricularia oryzae Y34]